MVKTLKKRLIGILIILIVVPIWRLTAAKYSGTEYEFLSIIISVLIALCMLFGYIYFYRHSVNDHFNKK